MGLPLSAEALVAQATQLNSTATVMIAMRVLVFRISIFPFTSAGLAMAPPHWRSFLARLKFFRPSHYARVEIQSAQGFYGARSDLAVAGDWARRERKPGRPG